VSAPVLSPKAADALRRAFDELKARGCDPELTADGRGLVATCPCCGEERGLTLAFPRADEAAS
jgi:hypothetical protein